MGPIARIEAWPVKVPLEAPYEMAPGTVAGIDRTIVRVTTSDGVAGLGEAPAPEDATAGPTAPAVLRAAPASLCRPRRALPGAAR